jgi:GNAT superfamily N-acetyltransferase
MRIEVYQGDRWALRALFALADHSESQVSSYIRLGEVLVAHGPAGEMAGHLQLIDTHEDGVLELKNMAVAEPLQGTGVGRALIEAAVRRSRAAGARRLIVSTATADTDNLRFYQRNGFRMFLIVQDAFGPATGYPDAIVIDGIPLRDQVFLELMLNP